MNIEITYGLNFSLEKRPFYFNILDQLAVSVMIIIIISDTIGFEINSLIKLKMNRLSGYHEKELFI